MRNRINLLVFLLGTFSLHAQTDYSFKVEVSGVGDQHIILIPGYTCSGEVWTSTLQTLNPTYSCHTLTMAGFAGHPAQTSPSLQAWVKEVANYITTAGLEKVIIIGHSLGGVMAQWLAADYPELIAKIIVVDALPALAALNNPAFKATDILDCSKQQAMFNEMDSLQFVQMQKMSFPMMTTDQTKYEQLLNWSLQSDRNTLALIYCQLMNTDLREKIGAVNCPALILLEANFKMIEDAIQQQYHYLKNGQLVYANKGMHFIMYDDVEWYFEQLSTFLL